MKLLSVSPTPANNSKKLDAEFCMCKGKTKCSPQERKHILFGSKDSKTYAEGADEKTRDAYLARHSVREDWTKPNAGSLSRYVLWSAKSINEGIKNFKKNINCK